MKKYLKKSFAVLTCTTMCIQTTMAILAERYREVIPVSKSPYRH